MRVNRKVEINENVAWALDEILTSAEAALLWNLSDATISYHVAAGNLPYRRSKRTLLIPKSAMMKLYGPMPKEPSKKGGKAYA